MRAFIDQHRETFGVEPLCRVLQIAPSGYRRHAAQQRNPARRSARAQRDEALMHHIQRVWDANLQVYGADKVWRQLHREGIPVARCTVERLMRRLGPARRPAGQGRAHHRAEPVHTLPAGPGQPAFSG